MKHAVWDDGKLFTYEDRIDHVIQLADPLPVMARRWLDLGIGCVWVMGMDLKVEEMGRIGPEWEWFMPAPTDEGRIRAISAGLREARGRRQVYAVFMAHSHWSAFRLLNAKQLLTAILYLEKALGVQMAGHPATVGWRLLESLHPEWLTPIEGDWQAMGFVPSAAPELIWQSPNLDSGKLQGYLHKFDRSLDYCYAAGSHDAFYGCGEPYQVGRERFSSTSVGVWRVRITEQPNYHGLPPLVRGKGEWHWLMTPIVRMLLHLGAALEIAEGWVFPEYHLLLQGWSKKLTGARDLLQGDGWKNRVAADAAARGIKAIANRTIGFTGYHEQGETVKRRPDIRLQTIARAVELRYYNLLKFQRETGKTPVMTYMDAAYFVDSQPDGEKILPSELRRAGKPGGWKWEGAMLIDDEVRAILRGEKGKAIGLKLMALNQKGWGGNA